MGIMVENCGCLGRDIQKTFDAYWLTVGAGKVITDWPDPVSTKINMENPIYIENREEDVFISVS